MSANPLKKPKTEEEAFDYARKFLLSAQKTGANSTLVTRWSFRDVVRGICHGQFAWAIDPLCIGAQMTSTPKDMDRVNRFITWVSSEKSPWRKLFENKYELVRFPDGTPAGFIFGEKTCTEQDFAFLKNFCILGRMFNERPNSMLFWDVLTQKYKVDGTDAMYIISCFTPPNIAQPERLNRSDVRMGGHWPISDFKVANNPLAQGQWEEGIPASAFINWKTFRSGDVPKRINYNTPTVEGAACVAKGVKFIGANNPYHYQPSGSHIPVNGTEEDKKITQPKVNGHFCWPTPVDYIPWDLTKVPMNQEGTTFSAVQYFSIENVLDSFYKWQDDQSLC